MPQYNEIYYENQIGGLCRLHSLNAFFGYHKIDVKKFRNYSKELDNYIKNKFHENSDCLKFDTINSDHNMIITFILKKYGVYSKYIPINSVYKNSDKIKSYINNLKGNFLFVYDLNHIWGIRRQGNIWYNVDSLNGIRRININSLSLMKNTGFIIPVFEKIEFFDNIKKIKNILSSNVPNYEEENIKKYLKKISMENKILGEIEVPLSISIDILSFVYDDMKLQKKKFLPIKNIIILYQTFLSEFKPSKYHDYELKNKYLSAILVKLMKLNTSP